jgi:hypothetical protein
VVSAPSHISPSHRTLRISLFPASMGHVSVDNAPSHTSPSHLTRCSLPQGDTSQWIMHRATHHRATALSGSRCSLPQEDTSQWITHRAAHHPATAFSGSRCSLPHNHGRYRMECEGRTAEDSNRSLPPGLPAVAGSMEQVCVCVCVCVCLRAQGPYCEGD